MESQSSVREIYGVWKIAPVKSVFVVAGHDYRHLLNCDIIHSIVLSDCKQLIQNFRLKNSGSRVVLKPIT